jgi:hypothetical protein
MARLRRWLGYVVGQAPPPSAVRLGWPSSLARPSPAHGRARQRLARARPSSRKGHVGPVSRPHPERVRLSRRLGGDVFIGDAVGRSNMRSGDVELAVAGEVIIGDEEVGDDALGAGRCDQARPELERTSSAMAGLTRRQASSAAGGKTHLLELR